ncbi:hypothetical protein GCM10020254_11020 [Streptomyces goshikiensis]
MAGGARAVGEGESQTGQCHLEVLASPASGPSTTGGEKGDDAVQVPGPAPAGELAAAVVQGEAQLAPGVHGQGGRPPLGFARQRREGVGPVRGQRRDRGLEPLDRRVPGVRIAGQLGLAPGGAGREQAGPVVRGAAGAALGQQPVEQGAGLGETLRERGRPGGGGRPGRGDLQGVDEQEFGEVGFGVPALLTTGVQDPGPLAQRGDLPLQRPDVVAP